MVPCFQRSSAPALQRSSAAPWTAPGAGCPLDGTAERGTRPRGQTSRAERFSGTELAWWDAFPGDRAARERHAFLRRREQLSGSPPEGLNQQGLSWDGKYECARI
ncbi:hypothetical protein DF268_22105 [Streptomyces sp. V2]|nr:hypothetical protein DF268_22105 [Streptomyces sp. V2]